MWKTTHFPNSHEMEMKTDPIMLKGHSDVVSVVAWSPDGRYVVSGSKDKSIRIWNVLSGECVLVLKKKRGRSSEINSVAWSPNGQYMASSRSRDKSISIWFIGDEPGKTISSGECVKALGGRFYEGHVSAVCSVAYSPSGQYVASGSDDESVCIWNVSSGECVEKLRDYSVSVFFNVGYTSVAWSPDGRYVISGSVDDSIRIWFIGYESGKPDVSRTESSDDCFKVLKDKVTINEIACSPDGQHVVSCGGHNRSLRLWFIGKASSGEYVKVIGEKQDHKSVAWSPNGQHVASGSYDNSIRIWNVSSGECVLVLRGNSSVWSVAYSPDGQYIVSGKGDGSICIYPVFRPDKLAFLMEIWSNEKFRDPKQRKNDEIHSSLRRIALNSMYDKKVMEIICGFM